MEGNMDSMENQSEGEIIAEIEGDIVEANRLLCGDIDIDIFEEVAELLNEDLLAKIETLSDSNRVETLREEYGRLKVKAFDGLHKGIRMGLGHKILEASSRARTENTGEARA
jgi:hypothetical protein